MRNVTSLRRDDAADDEPSVPLPVVVPEPSSPPPPHWTRKRLRTVLFAVGPLVVLAGALGAYLLGGRYVSTDNAYVHAGKLTVSTDVSGTVARIAVRENQRVAKGELLFALDDEPFRIALAGAEANLGAVRNQIATLKATYRQKLAQIAQAQSDISFFEGNFGRQQDLLKRGVTAQATFDQAKRELDAARERVTVAQRESEATLAQLGGTADAAIEQNPTYLAAQAQVDKARRDLSHAVVNAPIDGIVANVDALQVGEQLPATQPAFSLVATADVWVDANPKESDITFLKPGDTATVTVDAYPGRTWKASVISLSPATGGEFSVLPPQNASGNWVKVVQRVPVRLRVELPADAPLLRTGMSANVEIDTGRSRSLADLVESAKHTVGL